MKTLIALLALLSLPAQASLQFSANIPAVTATTHQFMTAYGITGGTKAQPACADLSNGAASCSTDTTVATNISSGTLPAGRLPALTGDVTSSAGSAATTVAAISGVTVTGATGTGNVAFATSPTLGNPKLNGFRIASVAKTSGYTITTADSYLTGDASGGTFSFTLPSATGTGNVYCVEKIDTTSTKVTIARAGSDTIEGQTTYDEYFPRESVCLIDAVSAAWRIFSRSNGTVVGFTPGLNSSTGVATNVGFANRVNNKLHAYGRITFNAQGAAGALTVGLPFSLAIDTTNMWSTGSEGIPGQATYISTVYNICHAIYQTTTTIAFVVQGGGGAISSNTTATGYSVDWWYELPISGWI